MTLPQSTHKDDRHPARYDEAPPAWGYPAPMQYLAQPEEPSMLDYWRVLAKRKWLILFLSLLGMALGYGATLVMPVKYKTEVSLMPLSSSGGLGGLGGLASQVGSMPMVGGALGDLGKMGSGKSKELVSILKSRTLAENVIRKFDLIKVLFHKQYDPKTDTFHPGFPAFLKPIPVMEDAVAKFQKSVTKVEEEKKTTLIRISVSMKDPVLAAKVANRMVLELQDFIENNSLTVSKRNRIFLEGQLVKTRVKLLETGKELNQFYAGNKISSVVPQIDVDLGTYQMNTKPFEEFEQEFGQLSQQEKVINEKREAAKVARVPGQIYLQFLTLSRELQIRAYALLTQQYELAKIEEAKEDLAFQVIDKAEVKSRVNSPRLIINLPAGLLFGMIFGVFVALFRDFVQKDQARREVRPS